MKTTLQNALAAAAIAALLTPGLAHGQAQNVWTGGVGGDWTDSTWSFFGPPLPGSDDEGVVGSTSAPGREIGEVDVATDIRVSNPTPTVVLGDGDGTDGTLNITGAMLVDSGGFDFDDVIVGRDGGAGVLNVSGGGILEIAGALQSTSGANPGSAINLSGSATVSAASATFDRALEINGAGVSLSTTGNTVFGLAGTHTWVIPAAGASTVSVGGNADLGGTLRVEFPDGTPAVGTTFDLIDAATIDANEAIPSGFSFVDLSGVSGLGPGERFATQTVAGGNGQIAQLVLQQEPVLLVDRNTGQVTISNPGGVGSIDIDVYAVTSPTVGALNPANWTSLESQGLVGGGWLEANPSVNALSELAPEVAGSVPAGTDISLGQVFNRPAPAAFGESNEDLQFRYASPGGGFVEGDIIFTGLPNDTLTLNVDPATGEAQLVNGTAFTVSIDAYVIDSASGSLDVGEWDSLEDQGADGGNWFEANSDANRLAELLVTGGLELSPDEVVNLGFLFDEAAGVQDLELRFALLPADATPGDFNGDGMVDGADYALWRNNLNGDASLLNGNGNGDLLVDAADLAIWQANFGATGGGAAGGEPVLLTGRLLYGDLVTFGAGGLAAAPEPGSAALLVIALSGAAIRRRR
ncbi:MAG: PEP-CTERM sorting domain-containing protein [Planctomycetota bacterium]